MKRYRWVELGKMFSQQLNEKSDGSENKVTLERVGPYHFKISFPDANKTTLMMDEPPQLGELKGPNAARVLAVSIELSKRESALLPEQVKDPSKKYQS
jgi:hypothetical protein